MSLVQVQIVATKIVLIDGECEIPAPPILQEPDHYKYSLRKALSLELRWTVSAMPLNHSRSPFNSGLLADSAGCVDSAQHSQLG